MVRYFAADLIRRIRPSALQAATLSGLNRNTVNRFYRGLRERIPLDCVARRPLFGVVEVDESFFGARRVKGWRGYNGLVDLGYGYFRVDHSNDEFAKPEESVPPAGDPSLGAVHRSGIEGFWGLAKVLLAKFKGLPRHTFHLHLKETEWRYNHRHADKYKTLLPYQGRTLRVRQNPLS